MSIVKLVNTGSTPVQFNGNERITLAPGASRLVQWEFACAWLGDPNVAASERAMVYAQQRLLWGFMAGMDTDEHFDNEKCPKVEVYDTERVDDDGQPLRLYMLLEDPEGLRARALDGQTDDTTSDVRLLQAQIAEQNARLARFEAMLAERLDTSHLDPAMQTALATAQATAANTIAPAGDKTEGDGDDAPGRAELPKPVATAANATDGPRTPKIRN